MTPQQVDDLMHLATHPQISRIDCLRMARDNLSADAKPDQILETAKVYEDFFNNQKF